MYGALTALSAIPAAATASRRRPDRRTSHWPARGRRATELAGLRAFFPDAWEEACGRRHLGTKASVAGRPSTRRTSGQSGLSGSGLRSRQGLRPGALAIVNGGTLRLRDGTWSSDLDEPTPTDLPLVKTSSRSAFAPARPHSGCNVGCAQTRAKGSSQLLPRLHRRRAPGAVSFVEKSHAKQARRTHRRRSPCGGSRPRPVIASPCSSAAKRALGARPVEREGGVAGMKRIAGMATALGRWRSSQGSSWLCLAPGNVRDPGIRRSSGANREPDDQAPRLGLVDEARKTPACGPTSPREHLSRVKREKAGEVGSTRSQVFSRYDTRDRDLDTLAPKRSQLIRLGGRGSKPLTQDPDTVARSHGRQPAWPGSVFAGAGS